MGVRELLEKIRMKEEDNEDEEPREIRDKYLESLRRERQVQSNEMEKQYLRKKIQEYKTEKMRKHLFGIGQEFNQKGYLGNVQNKKVEVLKNDINVLKQKNILSGQRSILANTNLDNKREEFKRRKRKIKSIL